ncbi:uncharacterized protein AB9W97_006666 [Spinachia spinachia]
MSQANDPKDSQSLLQSMLQRLNLQAQEYRHTPAPTTLSWGQNGERGAPILPRVFGISAAESTFGLRSREVQPPSHCCEVDKGLISSPSQKDNIEADTGEKRVLGHATQPGIIPTGTRQLFPAESLKDADVTSFERAGSGSTAGTRHVPSNYSDVTGMGQRFGDLTKSKEMQMVATNSSSGGKQASCENKTKRWTQKIKERWRRRPGSFSSTGVGGGLTLDLKNEHGPQMSSQKQLFTALSVVKTANTLEERTLPSLDSSAASSLPPTRTENNANEGPVGSTSDVPFGLGSFSLLEEIVTGQKWARFLNPNQSAGTANQRLPGLKIPSNLNDRGQTSLILYEQGGVHNQRDFKGSETSSDSGFITAQTSPDAFQAVGMDVLEAKQVHSEADQPEAMEHGHTCRPPLCAQPRDFLEYSGLRKRVQRSRKRPYHGGESLPMEGISNGKEAHREGIISSLRLTSNHVMEETGEEQRSDPVPLYNLNSASPLLAPAPRGVLKHSISQDSHSSMEIVIKRRRVEENRRVHFSEEVVAIAPPWLDSHEDQEDSVTEEEVSVAEQESEEQQAAVEEVAAPARRAALPAWIQALKRRNTRRKHR